MTDSSQKSKSSSDQSFSWAAGSNKECENDCASYHGLLSISIPTHPKVAFVVRRSVLYGPLQPAEPGFNVQSASGLQRSCFVRSNFCVAAGPGLEFEEMANENSSL